MNPLFNPSLFTEKLQSGSYPVIGNGSGRRVHDLENYMVLKAAKNIKGYAQNQAEYIISEMDHSDLFAKVLYLSLDNHYLVMEKAEQVQDFQLVLDYFGAVNCAELFSQSPLRNIPQQYNLILSDLCRPANWGMLGQRPVIIDYGFTGRIRRKYY